MAGLGNLSLRVACAVTDQLPLASGGWQLSAPPDATVRERVDNAKFRITVNKRWMLGFSFKM